MSLTQLNISLPVVVTSKQNSLAQCIAWIDYSPEHDLLWVCALDEDGSVWIVPNKEVRLQQNWSLNRRGNIGRSAKVEELISQVVPSQEKASA